MANECCVLTRTADFLESSSGRRREGKALVKRATNTAKHLPLVLFVLGNRSVQGRINISLRFSSFEKFM